jgi:hypothetical protein
LPAFHHRHDLRWYSRVVASPVFFSFLKLLNIVPYLSFSSVGFRKILAIPKPIIVQSACWRG